MMGHGTIRMTSWTRLRYLSSSLFDFIPQLGTDVATQKYQAKATFFITGNNLHKGQINDPSTPWPSVIQVSIPNINDLSKEALMGNSAWPPKAIRLRATHGPTRTTAS